jgi:hypothetical protein
MEKLSKREDRPFKIFKDEQGRKNEGGLLAKIQYAH